MARNRPRDMSAVLDVIELERTPGDIKRLPPEHNVSTHRGALAWFEEHVALGKAADEPFMVKQMLTPALARILLDNNPDNRKITESLVEEYANAMIADSFDSLNGEAIKVAGSGELNDGQNRAAALLKAATELPFLFIFGVTRESRTTLDQGKMRTSRDYMVMDGYGTTTVAHAAASIYLWQYRQFGTIRKRDRPTRSQIAKFAERHFDQIDESMKIIPRRNSGVFGGMALLTFAHLLFAEADRVKADEFMIGLLEGINLQEDSPIVSLRSRFSREKRLTRWERLEMMIRAWNAYYEGRELQNIICKGNLPPIAGAPAGIIGKIDTAAAEPRR